MGKAKDWLKRHGWKVALGAGGVIGAGLIAKDAMAVGEAVSMAKEHERKLHEDTANYRASRPGRESSMRAKEAGYSPY